MTPPKLCLNMIVKNEIENLPRLLTSVAPFVSTFAVLDTGSTDDTVKFVLDFFKERNVHGVIGHTTFLDFAQARNAALDLAIESEHKFDYVLLVDADMQLVVESETFPPLGQALYDMRQTSGSLDYDNVRLIHRQILKACRYRTPTHEYLSSPIPPQSRLAGAYFIDWATGSNRKDKFERDVRLLLGALDDNPADARAMFYLAETYRFMGKHEEAIAFYDKRIAAGGWDEEVWFASYAAARSCLNAAGDAISADSKDFEREGIARALEAYDLRPTRTEPLMLIANHLRNRSRNASAAMLAFESADRDVPADRLFVESDAYSYGPKQELAIAGFYSPNPAVREAGRDACFDLAIDRSAPEDVRAAARRNGTFYAKRLGELAPSTVIRKLEVGPRADFPNALNPSVVRFKGRLVCNVRRVNYVIDEGGRYMVHGRHFEHGDTIETSNEIHEVTPEGNELVTFLTDEACGERTDFYVKGYEDLRLFVWREELWATATVRDRHPQGNCEIALLSLDLAKGAITSARVLAPPPGYEGRHEKNWVPVAYYDDLVFVYMADPTITIHVSPSFDVTYVTHASDAALEHLRGSSQAVSWGDGGLLYVAHEALDREGQERFYLHRFVELDDETCQVRAVSPPFWFRRQGIEFCAGLSWLHDEGQNRDPGKLVLSFGARDAEAFLATVDASEVRLLLSPA